MTDKIEVKEKKHKYKTEFYLYNTTKRQKIITLREETNFPASVIHYPYDTRTFNPQFTYLKSVQYIGFGTSLPRGINNNDLKGLGFLKLLRPFFDYIDKNFQIQTVIIKKSNDVENFLDSSKHILTLNALTLDRLYVKCKTHNEKHYSDQKERMVPQALREIFPEKILCPADVYIKNTVHDLLNSIKTNVSNLTDLDKKAILDISDVLYETKDKIVTSTLLKTKDKIEEFYIEDVIKEYESFLTQKNNSPTLEKKWQDFLKTHSWIFSYALSLPVILFQNEAYVGGKNIANRNGKVTDFLIQNSLTQNITFLEIKTHKTVLVKPKPYRGNDVFSINDEITGAINQILNQRDNLQKSYYQIAHNSNQKFNTINSQGVLLAGCISDLAKAQIESFELFRNNSKDITLITFDELLAKIKKLLEIIKMNETK